MAAGRCVDVKGDDDIIKEAMSDKCDMKSSRSH
jgi:hypothetical protein